MKIAVVGCGALGSYYGAKLCRAGQDVHFLLRSDYEAVRQRGVVIRSRDGDFEVRPIAARKPDEIGPVDLVLIGLKTTANAEFPVLLPPLVGPHTVLLTLQNGLGNEELLAAVFPAEQIMGGLCFVCLNRIAAGVVRHLDHGRIVLGEFQRPPQPRTHDIAAMFRRADVPCDVTSDLARAHWEKLVWNIPFNGLGVASCVGLESLNATSVGARATRGPCFTTDILLADAGWKRLVRELMMEVMSVANALGLNLDQTVADGHIARTSTMGAYRASTVIDFEEGRPVEMESLFLEPLRLATQAGVATPRLEALCGVLRQLCGPGMNSISRKIH